MKLAVSWGKDRTLCKSRELSKNNWASAMHCGALDRRVNIANFNDWIVERVNSKIG